MAQLTSNDAQLNTASVLESGKGTMIFNTGDDNERRVNMAEIEFPILVPANAGITVEGSSILFYRSGSTATANAAFTHFRSYQGDTASTRPTWSLAEGSHIDVFSGDGLLKITEITDNETTSEVVVPLNRVQYPFRIEVPTVAGQVDSADFELIGSSFLMTS